MSAALARFKQLNPDEQGSFICRVRAEMIDEPRQFREMVAWHDANSFDESTLPGGTTRREWELHEQLQRAGKVDSPAPVRRFRG